MLILEGPDLSGKTTLMKDVVKEIGRRRWARKYGWNGTRAWHHARPGPGHDYDQEYTIVATDPTYVVTDRYALSELVYGPLLRSRVDPQVTSGLLRQCARRIMTRGGVQVLVSADHPTIKRRLLVRGADTHCQTIERYAALLHEYNYVLNNHLAMGRAGLPTMVVDTSDDTPEVYRLTLDSLMEQWQIHLDRAKAVAAEAPGGTGSLFPKILVVGTGPSFHAAEALTQILDGAGVGERWLRFMNTEWATSKAVHWLCPPIVVAVDNVAVNALRAEKIECRTFIYNEAEAGHFAETLRAWAWRLA